MTGFILSLKRCESCGDLREWPAYFPDTGLASADECVDCQSFAVPLDEWKAWEKVVAHRVQGLRG